MGFRPKNCQKVWYIEDLQGDEPRVNFVYYEDNMPEDYNTFRTRKEAIKAMEKIKKVLANP